MTRIVELREDFSLVDPKYANQPTNDFHSPIELNTDFGVLPISFILLQDTLPRYAVLTPAFPRLGYPLNEEDYDPQTRAAKLRRVMADPYYQEEFDTHTIHGVIDGEDLVKGGLCIESSRVDGEVFYRWSDPSTLSYIKGLRLLLTIPTVNREKYNDGGEFVSQLDHPDKYEEFSDQSVSYFYPIDGRVLPEIDTFDPYREAGKYGFQIALPPEYNTFLSSIKASFVFLGFRG